MHMRNEHTQTDSEQGKKIKSAGTNEGSKNCGDIAMKGGKLDGKKESRKPSRQVMKKAVCNRFVQMS